jgi:hypothetical protein
MPVQALSQIDPKQFFRPPSTDGATPQRLNTQVSGVSVSNDLSGRLSVTTAEGDTITLTADLEYDFRAVNYSSHVTGDGSTVDLEARYAEATLKKEFGVTIEGDLNEQELKDLEKLFRKVSNIFRSFFQGNDEAGLAKTAKLAERLEQLPSLSGLDLSVDVQRSVTILAAQIASAVTDRPVVPTGQEVPSSTTSSTDTPGGAPATDAVIPPSSTGAAAPTPASSVTGPAEGVHLSAPAQSVATPPSLAQQVLDALKETRAESRTVRKYLPDFLEKLREDLTKELRADREQKSTPRDESTDRLQTPVTTSTSVVFAYQSIHQTSVALSIHS